MNLAILHSLPLLDASLDSTTLAWLIGGLVVALVLLVLGVLVTTPSRRRAQSAVPANPAEALAPAAPAPAPTADTTPVAPEPASPAPILEVPAAPALLAAETPAPVAPEAASEPAPIQTPITDFASLSPSTFAPESSQPAIPIPVGPDFSASGPIMLPSSMVAATFGSAADAPQVTTGPLMPSPDEAPALQAVVSPASFVTGPLIPLSANEPAVPAAPAVPFVVTPAHSPAAPVSAPKAALPSTNSAVHTERVPLPEAVDLFAHSYGRSNAAMLSATERAAASRIARALHDDLLAVQLAAMYAAEAHRPLDALAQLLEADRRNRFGHSGEHQIISDADALDVFAHSYGRSNAAMLSATERAAASRIVHALDDDPLAVRLAAMYAADTQRPLDRLANRLEADLRHAGGYDGHHRHHVASNATTDAS